MDTSGVFRRFGAILAVTEFWQAQPSRIVTAVTDCRSAYISSSVIRSFKEFH